MADVSDGEFLADAQNQALTSDEMARMADPTKPDRLAWNTFRTLALWETDIWIPRLLDIGLDFPNPLSEHEWAGASVQLWALVQLRRQASTYPKKGPVNSWMLVDGHPNRQAERVRISHSVGKAIGDSDSPPGPAPANPDSSTNGSAQRFTHAVADRVGTPHAAP